MARRAPDARPRPGAWTAYAACAWAFVFAAPSLYWSLGGSAGVETARSPGISELAATHPPWFVAVLWATFAMKAVAGLLALALVRPWGRFVPRPLLLGGAWVAGANNLSEIR